MFDNCLNEICAEQRFMWGLRESYNELCETYLLLVSYWCKYPINGELEGYDLAILYISFV